MPLTPSEKNFLYAQKIKPEHVLDARGMPSAVWKAKAKKEGFLFIIGAPCHAAGHRLRTRAGHCIQCDTAKIAYVRRSSQVGYVYIAASRIAGLLKIGSCIDLTQRQRNLRAQAYGGIEDWQIIAYSKTAMMGQVEFEINRKLEDLYVPGYYEKDGRTQHARELLRGDLKRVWDAYSAVTKEIQDDLKWRHSTFDNFNFIERSE
ncbi:GIY-YIG nuclease family protein [Thalassobaculum sp.]|uniref:GIY-YIG nuclease family protein n=1 Tax=Thalassobaculum sp. TaxID=2022740 RepID=UPI0032EEBEE2